MARPRKKGLEYFPVDVDMFSDIKLRKLIRCQGGKAVTVYVCLLCIIYENGYYIRWDEDLLFIISERTGYEEAYIQEVLKSCLAVGLFDRAMWADGVLTSRGIQYRYTEVSSRRTSTIREYSLISAQEDDVSAAETEVSAAETGVSATETRVSATETPQSKVKKRKENTVTAAGARAHMREAEWHDELLHDGQFNEAVTMNLNVSPDKIPKLLEEFRREQQAKGTAHTDRANYRSHAYDWLRLHTRQTNKQNDGGNRTDNQQTGYERRRREAAELIEEIRQRPRPY